MTRTDPQTVVITDYDYGDVAIERAIIEGAGLQLTAAQCRTEADVIEVAHDADAIIAQYATVGAKAIAARAAGFGMRVIAHDPYVADADIAAHGATPVSFIQLLEQSDYLVIQAPLTEETHHLIGEAELRRMKPTAFLINTARGPIVSDEALYRGLREGWIAGAGLDDIEEEPAKVRDWKPDNPLFTLPNAVLTPHSAYYSEESIHTVRDFAAHEVVRVLTGQRALSPVNAAELATAERS